MTERELQAAVEALCKYAGATYYHSWSSKHSAPGFPDLVILTKDNRVLWRELKTERGKLTFPQVRWGERLRCCGQDAAVWRPDDLHSGRIQRELSPVQAIRGVN